MAEHMGELLFGDFNATDQVTSKGNLHTNDPELPDRTSVASDNVVGLMHMGQESIDTLRVSETWMSNRLKSNLL